MTDIYAQHIQQPASQYTTHQHTAHFPKRRSFFGRIVSFLFKLGLLFILASLLLVIFYRFVPVPYTLTMAMDEQGAARDWAPLDDISPHMVRAVISAEDGKFCQHNGFDFEAMKQAAKQNARGKRIRGGSTISQQTAKNVFLWQGGGYVRKGLEAWFTGLIELVWGKRRIMEVYLNVAETGIGTYGVEAGAHYYFKKNARDLSKIEAARMAAALPLPKKRGVTNAKGFTRRYGNTISARAGAVKRDQLDSCIYAY